MSNVRGRGGLLYHFFFSGCGVAKAAGLCLFCYQPSGVCCLTISSPPPPPSLYTHITELGHDEKDEYDLIPEDRRTDEDAEEWKMMRVRGGGGLK